MVTSTATALAELAAASAPPTDGRVREDFIRLLRRVPGAMHRDGDAFTPDGRRLHLTAGAFVVDATAEHLVLLWHRKGQFWVQPGGHIDPGETSLEAAARREVTEETGLSDLERIGPGPALLHAHELAGGFGPCGAHWDVEYLMRAPRPAAELPLSASDESEDLRWVPWHRDARDARDLDLPAGTVPDLAEKLLSLAPLISRGRR